MLQRVSMSFLLCRIGNNGQSVFGTDWKPEDHTVQRLERAWIPFWFWAELQVPQSSFIARGERRTERRMSNSSSCGRPSDSSWRRDVCVRVCVRAHAHMSTGEKFKGYVFVLLANTFSWALLTSLDWQHRFFLKIQMVSCFFKKLKCYLIIDY